MRTKFVNEIEQDYALYCSRKLQYVDSSYSHTGDRSILDYHRYKFRKIFDTPRKLFIPSGFQVSNKFESTIKSILQAIENGTPLLKYQSRLLKRTDYDDALLMDWGVQHLHLGESIDSDGFVSRTKELLFIRFTKHEAYVLGVFDHSDWNTIDVLEVIHENWPDSIERFRVSRDIEILNSPADSDTIKQFRKVNLNTPIHMADGTVYFGPGGGITTANTPIEVTHNIMHLNRVFESAYNRIIHNFEKMCQTWCVTEHKEQITIGLELTEGKLVYTLKEIGQRVSFD